MDALQVIYTFAPFMGGYKAGWRDTPPDYTPVIQLYGPWPPQRPSRNITPRLADNNGGRLNLPVQLSIKVAQGQWTGRNGPLVHCLEVIRVLAAVQ